MINENAIMTHGSIPPGRRPGTHRPGPAKHWLILAAGSAAACGLLAGCGAAGAATQGSGQGESITLLSG
jgi:hypothetical protein